MTLVFLVFSFLIGQEMEENPSSNLGFIFLQVENEGYDNPLFGDFHHFTHLLLWVNFYKYQSLVSLVRFVCVCEKGSLE